MESRPADQGDRYLLFDEPTEVRKADAGEMRFGLENCYPNPANPDTQIAFSLAQSGPARLSIHNALGQEVLTLFDGVLGAGAHTVMLDASLLPTGVYYYALRQEEYRQVKKLVVMR